MRLPQSAARLAPLALVAALALTACGSEDDDPTSDTSPGAAATSDGGQTVTDSPTGPVTDDSPGDRARIIDINIQGGTVTPSGQRIEVDAGKEITIAVTSDAPGSLHVHGTPEQELEFKAGTTELALTIDKPGVVDVESHELGVVVVQLEVR